MMIKDRFTAGFISGVIAGLVMSVLDLLSYVLFTAKLVYIQWASMFIFGERFEGMAEAIVAQIGQLLFTGALGIIFVYLIKWSGSRHIYFKGVVFALIVWFTTYAIIVLFDIKELIPVRIETVLSNIVTVIIYGAVLALAFKKIYADNHSE